MKKKITTEGIRQYAVASKDWSAVHLDPEAATKAGFKRPIAHGMYIMGIAHSMYLSKYPAQWIQSSQMTFQSPLLSETMAHFEFCSINKEVQVTVIGENGEVIARGCFSVGGDLENE